MDWILYDNGLRPERVKLKKWIDQEEMPLEKNEDFLELSVKKFVIQSSSISLGWIMCGVWKTKH